MVFGPCSPNDCLSYAFPFLFSPSQFPQASGILKGFDPLLNLVLDGTIEYMRGECSRRGSEPPHWALLTAPGPPACHLSNARGPRRPDDPRHALLLTVPAFLTSSLDHCLGALKHMGPLSLASWCLLGAKNVPGVLRKIPARSGAPTAPSPAILCISPCCKRSRSPRPCPQPLSAQGHRCHNSPLSQASPALQPTRSPAQPEPGIEGTPGPGREGLSPQGTVNTLMHKLVW